MFKAKWQAEIRAYSAHLHLIDGQMDMSMDMGCAAICAPASSLTYAHLTLFAARVLLVRERTPVCLPVVLPG